MAGDFFLLFYPIDLLLVAILTSNVAGGGFIRPYLILDPIAEDFFARPNYIPFNRGVARN